MIKWGIVLHFYQPPTQSSQVTAAVFEQCYEPLVELIATQPRARVTINISGSLINHPIFGKLKPGIESGQVELLVSPATHPLLPLVGNRVTQEILKRQQDKIKAGVYPPELAVDEGVIERVSPFGEYCLVDESSVRKDWDMKTVCAPVYEYKGKKLLASSRMVTEILRSYPTELKVEPFVEFLNDKVGDGGVIVSVNDAELFGHHYRERLEFLHQILSDSRFEFLTANQIVKENSSAATHIDELISSTWQTGREELEKNLPWALWLTPDNDLQKQYWNLAQMAEQLLEPFWDQVSDPGLMLDSARAHYYVGISSCHLYWLSNKPWWHPDLVEEGATHLMRCIRGLPIGADQKTIAEKLHKKFIAELWQYHWSGEVEKKYADYDEVRKNLLAALPVL